LPILLAVAADALINLVVLLFDPAVEGCSGRTLRLFSPSDLRLGALDADLSWQQPGGISERRGHS
jgi:hypothetical protein